MKAPTILGLIGVAGFALCLYLAVVFTERYIAKRMNEVPNEPYHVVTGR